MLLPPNPQQQPSIRIEVEMAIWDHNMSKVGSVAQPEATCREDSHSDIYIVIPLLITPNIFIGSSWKVDWGENGRIYDNQHSRLIPFLITVNYTSLACPIVKFKAKTNSKQRLLRTQYMEDLLWINSTFFLHRASWKLPPTVWASPEYSCSIESERDLLSGQGSLALFLALLWVCFINCQASRAVCTVWWHQGSRQRAMRADAHTVQFIITPAALSSIDCWCLRLSHVVINDIWASTASSDTQRK